MKYFLKTLIILVLLSLGYIFGCMVYMSRFIPDDGVKNFKDLKSQGVPMIEAYRVSNPENHICVFGDIDSVSWTLPSGPPAYLFDQIGALVDFALDIGESSKFKSEYKLIRNEKIKIQDLESEFSKHNKN